MMIYFVFYNNVISIDHRISQKDVFKAGTFRHTFDASDSSTTLLHPRNGSKLIPSHLA